MYRIIYSMKVTAIISDDIIKGVKKTFQREKPYRITYYCA